MKKKRVFPARTVYYASDSDDFLSLGKREDIRIDASYDYSRDTLPRRIGDFIAYRLLATPAAFLYTKLKFRERFIGKEKLKAFNKTGYYIYSNHTQPIADAFSPNVLTYPKKNSVIINKDNLNLPILGRHLKRLGGLPLPDDLKAARAFALEIEKRIGRGEAVTVYPEAHVWEYHTEIRDFPDSALDLPLRTDSPVFTATRTYRLAKRRVICDIYVDGPFLPDQALPRRDARAKLKSEVYSAMKERSRLSDVKVVEYIRKEESDVRSE